MRIPRFTTLQLLLAAAFCGLVCGLLTTVWRSSVHRQIDAIAFSPSGKTLAARYAGGSFQAWSVSSGATRLSAQTSMGRAWRDEWRPVRFADDDKLIDIQHGFRSGSPIAEVRVIDLRGARTKSLLALPHISGNPPFAAASDRIAVGNWSAGTIECYDLASRQLVQRVPGTVASPFGLDLTPDGKRLLFFDQDSTLRVVDVASGHGVQLAAYPGTIVAEVTRDGRYVATSDNFGSAVELHDLATGQPPDRISHTVGASEWLAFSADGRRLAIGGDAAVELYDLATVKRIGRVALGEFSRSSLLTQSRAYSLGWQQLSLSPDAATLAALSGDQITLWDLKTGRRRSTIGGSLRTAQAVIFTFGFALWSVVWGIVAHRSGVRSPVTERPPLELRLCWGLIGIGGLVAIAVPVSLFILSGTLFWPTMYYSLLMGILAVSRSAGRDTRGPRQVASLQMLNLIALDPVNFLLGLLALALLRRPHVRQFLAQANARSENQPTAEPTLVPALGTSHV